MAIATKFSERPTFAQHNLVVSVVFKTIGFSYVFVERQVLRFFIFVNFQKTFLFLVLRQAVEKKHVRNIIILSLLTKQCVDTTKLCWANVGLSENFVAIARRQKLDFVVLTSIMPVLSKFQNHAIMKPFYF